MKFALVVCFAALVACEPEAQPEAKADPWLTYGYGAYPYAYSGLYHGYAGYPYTHGLYYGKRSAEAEPEAAAKADLWSLRCLPLRLLWTLPRLCRIPPLCRSWPLLRLWCQALLRTGIQRLRIWRIQRLLLWISSQHQKHKAEAQSEHHSLLSDLISFSTPL